MSLPIELPAPPVIVQDPARCWEAAFASWDRAVQDAFGLAPGPDQDRLLRWLSDGSFLTRQGRATDDGVAFLGNLGFMRMQWFEGWQVMPKLLGRLLRLGPLYCAYYWDAPRGGRRGHAVVIHGASRDLIKFMDPAPGRGLVKERASFFARESRSVMLGSSLLGELSRSLSL